MENNKYVIKDKDTGEVHRWTLKRILKEINCDRSDTWIPYNENDWEEGLKEFTNYELLGKLEMNKMEKIKLKEFKKIYMGKNSKWDWKKFKITCNKCGSNKVEFNGWFESEEGYYGDHSLEGAIIIKCHACGNAFKIDNYDAEEFNTDARKRVSEVKYDILKEQTKWKKKKEY
jgi:hypothetical protein